MGGLKVAPNPSLMDRTDVYLSTGMVAENHAREHAIRAKSRTRSPQRSHQRAGGRYRRRTFLQMKSSQCQPVSSTRRAGRSCRPRSPWTRDPPRHPAAAPAN